MDMQLVQLKQQSLTSQNKQQPLQEMNAGNNQEQQPQLQMNEANNQRVQINPPLINRDTKTYKSFLSILGRVLNLCFSSFYFGYTIGYLGSFDFKSIVTIYNITDNVKLIEGLLQAILSVGGGVGALSAGILIRYFSRRNSVLIINFFAIIFGLMVLVPNLTLFFIGRFFQGMCVGLFSAIIPILIKEYSPKQLSGTFGALHQTSIAFGVFFSFAFQLILLQVNGELQHWRTQHGFTLITIGIQTALLLVVYKEQTPKYLLLNHREEDCKKIIKKIYMPQYIDVVLNQKKTQNSTQLSNVGANANLNDNRKLRIFVAVHLAILQQFVGINAVTAYGVEIVNQVLPDMKKLIPVILDFEVIIGGLFSSYLLRRVGRVTILQVGTFVSFISLLFVAVGFIIYAPSVSGSGSGSGSALIMIGLFLFMLNFGYSLGPVVWLYIPEVVETQIIPFSTLANWTASTLVILLFPVLTNAFDTPVPLFFFFAGWSLAAFFINKKYLVETKLKTVEQIRQQFSQK